MVEPEPVVTVVSLLESIEAASEVTSSAVISSAVVVAMSVSTDATFGFELVAQIIPRTTIITPKIQMAFLFVSCII